MWLDAQSSVGFQELGGPRSVSGDPIDKTIMAGWKGDEILPPACSGGLEISTLRNSAN
jgi:hypothetical protein